MNETGTAPKGGQFLLIVLKFMPDRIPIYETLKAAVSHK